ncbi:hypothetical protein FAUST_11482 [Fusarium austroamericanum]|uniref:Aminoglycoside phosphotransferase domain-containing protein n=1 Tax=Fusarium austroamericanum TaxID=282268 RepID=A0AAN6BUC6_FUSAU|nr:hypothetical protein FAUST_11482 [Fusarium austroamericanum]
MLISALHYAWNKGDLAAFEPTFLFHKIESIKQVNTWLTTSSRAKEILRCAKYISTLCFVECCLGNFAVAESHLNGLAIYLSTKDREALRKECDCDVDLELTDRYLVVASNMIHSTKSRLAEVVPPEVISQPSDTDLEVPELSRMIHKMHLSEANGPELRLRAFRMVPFFFGSIPPGREPKDLDMFPAISILRPITELAMPTNSKDRGDPDIPMPWNVWNSGAPSKLLYTVITAHIQSFSNKIPLPTHGEPVYVSAWSGFCSAVDFYLTTVLAVCNQGLPPQRILHYLKVDIIKRDLQNGPPLFDNMNTETRNLWFWKAFIWEILYIETKNTIFLHLTPISFYLAFISFKDIHRNSILFPNSGAMSQEIPESESNLVHKLKHHKAALKFKRELWDKRNSIVALVKHHLRLDADDTCTVLGRKTWMQGIFNICVLVEVTTGNSSKKLIFRCPIPPHAGQYPSTMDEKVGCEVATYIWMQQYCPDIRIPNLFAFGFTDDRSFIHIERTPIYTRLWRKAWKWIYRSLGYPVLSDYIRDKAAPVVGSAYMLMEHIGPEIGKMLASTWFDHLSDTARRKNLFTGIARTMLSLARIPQQHIGAFRFNTLDCTIALSNRPLTCTVAVFEQQGAPRTIPEDRVYQNTDSFASDMLTLHDNYLLHDPHAVRNKADARERMALRTLIRSVAHFFVLPERRSGPYLLQPTDLHPSNVFVDEQWNVTCLIDLEWICALPLEMMSVPSWITNCTLDEIAERYEDFDNARKEFLSIMDKELQHVQMEHDIQITRVMRESWESKGVWYWFCIESVNCWLFVFESHILPMFSSAKELVKDLKKMSLLWHKDARKHIQTKAADERRYQLELRSLLKPDQSESKE